MESKCNGCGKTANDIRSYDDYTTAEGYTTNEEFVLHEEGTYNAVNGHFWCDPCYIGAGMPLGVAP